MSAIEEVYEKYKHLDGPLSDTEWCTSGEGAAIYAIAGELWRAVKEAQDQPRPPCEECHWQSKSAERNEQVKKHERDWVLHVRPEVMKFAMAMELVLRKNDFKGGWEDLGYYKLLECAYDELEECRREMREAKSGCMRRASREIVDVANFCMMFFDNLYRDPINSKYLKGKLESLRLAQPEPKAGDPE